jgi:hypothetical protein
MAWIFVAAAFLSRSPGGRTGLAAIPAGREEKIGRKVRRRYNS